jgi:hypothetical protein
VEFIPWSELALAPVGPPGFERSRTLLWNNRDYNSHIIYTEDDVFSFFTDHIESLESFIVDDKMLFIATTLKDTDFVSDLFNYWSTWVRLFPASGLSGGLS